MNEEIRRAIARAGSLLNDPPSPYARKSEDLRAWWSADQRPRIYF